MHLIVGPKDTVSILGGIIFSNLSFLGDYPHKPPILKYCTNDGVRRDFIPICIKVVNVVSLF